jgi:hypothetical protein
MRNIGLCADLRVLTAIGEALLDQMLKRGRFVDLYMALSPADYCIRSRPIR